VIDTNSSTLYLIQKVGREIGARGQGHILMTGSIAGFMPGTFQAVYRGTKAFINAFSFALYNAMQDSGVTVTCLMPGPTETEFLERADMLDTQVGQQEKDDPADIANVLNLLECDSSKLASCRFRVLYLLILRSLLRKVFNPHALTPVHGSFDKPEPLDIRGHHNGKPTDSPKFYQHHWQYD
jgi:short-subunit dehydrogenase